jgi:hypothetical protein
VVLRLLLALLSVIKKWVNILNLILSLSFPSLFYPIRYLLCRLNNTIQHNIIFNNQLRCMINRIHFISPPHEGRCVEAWHLTGANISPQVSAMGVVSCLNPLHPLPFNSCHWYLTKLISLTEESTFVCGRCTICMGNNKILLHICLGVLPIEQIIQQAR